MFTNFAVLVVSQIQCIFRYIRLSGNILIQECFMYCVISSKQVFPDNKTRRILLRPIFYHLAEEKIKIHLQRERRMLEAHFVDAIVSVAFLWSII